MSGLVTTATSETSSIQNLAAIATSWCWVAAIQDCQLHCGMMDTKMLLALTILRQAKNNALLPIFKLFSW